MFTVTFSIIFNCISVSYVHVHKRNICNDINSNTGQPYQKLKTYLIDICEQLAADASSLLRQLKCITTFSHSNNWSVFRGGTRHKFGGL